MRHIFRILNMCVVWIAASFCFVSCIPASISRIGPPRARKPEDCEIRVLPPGETPDRPWVDIGVVHLENCQEYHVGMCRKWLIEKACELGGEVAYLPDPEPPKESVHPVPIMPTNNDMRVSDPAAVVNFRVLVAVYAVGLSTPFPGTPGCLEPPAAPKSGGGEGAEPDTDSGAETDATESDGGAETPAVADPTARCKEL